MTDTEAIAQLEANKASLEAAIARLNAANSSRTEAKGNLSASLSQANQHITEALNRVQYVINNEGAL